MIKAKIGYDRSGCHVFQLKKAKAASLNAPKAAVQYGVFLDYQAPRTPRTAA